MKMIDRCHSLHPYIYIFIFLFNTIGTYYFLIKELLCYKIQQTCAWRYQAWKHSYGFKYGT